MADTPPVITVWRDPALTIEAGQSDEALITTEAGDYLTTEDSLDLQIEDGDYTTMPASTWTINDSQ